MGGCKASNILFAASIILMLMLMLNCCVGDQGTATFYTPPYVPSSCYGNDPNQFPAGNLFAAASDVIWDNRAACGRNYRIRCLSGTNQGVQNPCKDGSIVVKIVDYCPPGCAGTFDLSADAFADIADPNEGKINIEYELA